MPENGHPVQPTKVANSKLMGNNTEAITDNGVMSPMDQVTKKRPRCADGCRPEKTAVKTNRKGNRACAE